MRHKFKIERLPNDTLMVCQCGLTYHWEKERWEEVAFKNVNGFTVDPPEGDCGTSIDLTGEIVESEEE